MRGRRLCGGGDFLPTEPSALLRRWTTRKGLCAPPPSRRRRQGGTVCKKTKNKRNEATAASRAVGNRCPVTGLSTFLRVAAEALPLPLLPPTMAEAQLPLPKVRRVQRAAAGTPRRRPASTPLSTATATTSGSMETAGLSTSWGWNEDDEKDEEGLADGAAGRRRRSRCPIPTPFDAWRTSGEGGKERF